MFLDYQNIVVHWPNRFRLCLFGPFLHWFISSCVSSPALCFVAYLTLNCVYPFLTFIIHLGIRGDSNSITEADIQHNVLDNTNWNINTITHTLCQCNTNIIIFFLIYIMNLWIFHVISINHSTVHKIHFGDHNITLL